MSQFARLKKYNYLILMVILSSVSHSQTIENFDDISTLHADGWVMDNRSDFPTKVNWFQGIETIFPAQTGVATSYIANSTATGNNIICNWLIMPDIGNIDQLSFYTRSADNTDDLTRMFVMYSPTGSINTGNCENPVNKNSKGVNDFGDFQQLLAINPNQILDGYPKTWTQYTADVNGSGRVAFLYYVTGTGMVPFNSGLLAIDTISAGSGVGINAQIIPIFTQTGIISLFLILIFTVYLNSSKLRYNK